MCGQAAGLSHQHPSLSWWCSRRGYARLEAAKPQRILDLLGPLT